MEYQDEFPEIWYQFILEAEITTLVNWSPAEPCDGGEQGESYLSRLARGGPGITRTAILENADRVRMVEAIQRGIQEADGQMKCFWPHHALEAQRDERKLCVVICYECCLIRAYFEGQKVEVATSRFSEAIFDAYFPEYKIAREMAQRVEAVYSADLRELQLESRINVVLQRIEALKLEIHATPLLDNRTKLLSRLRDMQDHLK